MMNTSPQLEDIVSGRKDLPTLPGIALNLIEAVTKEDAGLNGIGEIISTDPPLTAKVLKLVNSPYYGLRQPIMSIQKAINMLGLNTIKNIALSFSLIETYKASHKQAFDYANFWKRSLISATSCKLLAARVCPELAEDAFFLGLIHDLGILTLLHCYPDDYQMVIGLRTAEGCSYHDAEDECLNVNHMEVGHYLTQAWGLPTTFSLPILHHHNPLGLRTSDTDITTLTKMLHLASLCADIYEGDDSTLKLGLFEWYLKEYEFYARIDIEAFFYHLTEQVHNIFPVFDMQPDSVESWRAIIDDARQELIQLSLADDATIHRNESSPSAVPNEQKGSENKKILIVDDEERNVILMKAMLQNENCELFGLFDGEQVFKTIDKINPDIILLDVMMPGIDGFKICQRIKQNEKTRMIPVLMVTALNKKEHRQKALEVGADDYLSKPIDRTELELRVRSLLKTKTYHDQLLASYYDIRRKNARLKELENTKEGLIHMIVHDMNNPLHSIACILELLQVDKTAFSDRQYDLMANGLKCCGDLAQMVQSLLDIHKMENGDMVLDKKATVVPKFIDEVVDLIKAQIEASKISFLIAPNQDLPDISVDVSLMKRVMLNLINNAVRHTPAGGTIEIGVTPPNGDGMFRFSVTDSGQGIRPEDRERIFNKFEQSRLRKNGDKRGASGLGLTFCKLAVEAHGGKIWAESEGHDTGSAFRFTLPV